jgi:2-methylcitrate dehydratase PrpD
MSIQYNVASALIHGHFDEANYRPAEQPAVADLARRVRVIVDEALTAAYPSRQGAAIGVRLRSGETLEHAAAEVRVADGASVLARLAEAATARVGGERSRQLLDFVETLDSAADAGRLLALTQPE